MDKYVMGIDIGGSHITAALLDMENKIVLENTYVRKKINSRAAPDQILKAWASVIADTFKKAGLKTSKLGIAMPGPFDYQEGISYMSKYKSLYGLNVKEMLAAQLNILPSAILMKNDAACFLAGEAFSGVAQGFNKVIGLTLGTGLGTSIFEAGEVKDAGLWFSPFLDGIAEDYISTRWFLKRYYELSGINVVNVKEMVKLYPNSLVIKDIFEEFAINLAAFLNYFQQLTKAEAIVIGGNITNAAHKFLPTVLKQLKKHQQLSPVYISKLNEHATLIGAASSWQNL